VELSSAQTTPLLLVPLADTDAVEPGSAHDISGRH